MSSPETDKKEADELENPGRRKVVIGGLAFAALSCIFREKSLHALEKDRKPEKLPYIPLPEFSIRPVMQGEDVFLKHVDPPFLALYERLKRQKFKFNVPPQWKRKNDLDRFVEDCIGQLNKLNDHESRLNPYEYGDIQKLDVFLAANNGLYVEPISHPSSYISFVLWRIEKVEVLMITFRGIRYEVPVVYLYDPVSFEDGHHEGTYRTGAFSPVSGLIALRSRDIKNSTASSYRSFQADFGDRSILSKGKFDPTNPTHLDEMVRSYAAHEGAHALAKKIFPKALGRKSGVPVVLDIRFANISVTWKLKGDFAPKMVGEMLAVGAELTQSPRGNIINLTNCLMAERSDFLLAHNYIWFSLCSTPGFSQEYKKYIIEALNGVRHKEKKWNMIDYLSQACITPQRVAEIGQGLWDAAFAILSQMEETCDAASQPESAPVE